MNFDLSRFSRDQRGSSFEGIALSVAIIAVAFVASADMLDYTLKKRAAVGPAVAALQAAGESARRGPAAPASIAANGSGLDTAPTGSLPALITRSVLDPCTGRTR